MTRRALSGLCAAAALVTLSAPRSVDANLPASAITELSVAMYGLYTTSDPLCQTGLVATLPLTATPTAANLAASPTLGTGDLPPDGIACVVIVVKDSFMLGWAAGSYTGTSQFGTSTFDDSNCDPGGSEGPLEMCRDSNKAPTWPQRILDDLSA
ncbi:MAG TPA: hypothetical protein VGP93_16250, partial [Polyangiaceae bacterium]|nr:hypothetical protein [Polyangiaceae bacterium]